MNTFTVHDAKLWTFSLKPNVFKEKKLLHHKNNFQRFLSNY